MAALDSGRRFPAIPLTDASGAPVERPEGETLYAVFKTTCPTCELTWPFLERIRAMAGSGGNGLRILAVSQDDPRKTADFNARLGTKLETVYDAPPYPASDALGVTNVPTLFRVGPDGKVAETVIGFDRARMESLAKRAASLAGRPAAPLFRPGDNAPAAKPG